MQKAPPPIDDTPRVGNRRKNTKKWCRGKIGVEHQPVMVFDVKRAYLGLDCAELHRRSQRWSNSINWCLHMLECTNCGKITKSYVLIEDCPTINGAS